MESIYLSLSAQVAEGTFFMIYPVQNVSLDVYDNGFTIN